MNRELESLDAVFREMPDLKVEHTGPRRTRIQVEADALPTLLELLKGRAGYLHLSAISCVDWPDTEEFELVYHLWSYQVSNLISAHTRIPYDPGRYVSVYDLHAPAVYFERDIHEMFGVWFEGCPDQEPFILTEWQGPPPMRKSFDTVAYVNDTFEWREYQPEWANDPSGGKG
ncbi:MAG: NADH-quinone oxidoreductase subunit C [Chromatiales bacterium]|nr:NADH-quinone oxidoreductase subunit C [Chromatiales bacterium]